MKNILVAGAVSLGVALVVVLGFSKPAIIKNDPSLGAQPVDITNSKCVSFNGRVVCSEGKKLNQATSTVCSIKSPSATSTLTSANIVFDFASSSALVLDIGRGTVESSTSSAALAFAYNLIADTRNFVQASTSPGGVGTTTSPVPTGSTAMVFPPNTFLNFKLYGNGLHLGTAASAASLAPRGYCNAAFEAVGAL